MSAAATAHFVVTSADGAAAASSKAGYTTVTTTADDGTVLKLRLAKRARAALAMAVADRAVTKAHRARFKAAWNKMDCAGIIEPSRKEMDALIGAVLGLNSEGRNG